MPYITVYKDIEVELNVELGDFNDGDLLEEIESRGLGMSANSTDLVRQVWELRRTNQPYDHLMDELFYATLGKIA